MDRAHIAAYTEPFAPTDDEIDSCFARKFSAREALASVMTSALSNKVTLQCYFLLAHSQKFISTLSIIT
jgi:hypothetical protein